MSYLGHTYEELGPIGDGSYGAVLRVRRDGQELAAKVLESEDQWVPVDDVDEETTVSAMALRELGFMTLLTRLRAPHVVPLLDFGFELGDTQALVLYMPLYARDLAAVIEDETLPPRARLGLAGDVLTALAFLHGCTPAIVHRDIKPENILVDAQDRAHLADLGFCSFGTAQPSAPPLRCRRCRARARSPSHSGTVGTPTYVAPEMLQGGPAHPSLDLWAVGITLLELFDNRRLSASDDETAIRRVRRRRGGFDGPRVLRLLAGLLADAPERRTPAAALLADLRTAGLRREPPAAAPDLTDGTAPPPVSAAIAGACAALAAKVPQTALAAQRYCEAAPDLDPRVAAAVASKVYEHRPLDDDTLLQRLGLDIDALEEGQEALVRKLGGHMLRA